MARLNKGDKVRVTFQTRGLDNEPYKAQTQARVLEHKEGGWLYLKFLNQSQIRYRVHRNKDGGGYENYNCAPVFVVVEPLIEAENVTQKTP